MPTLGAPELILILVIVLVIFGAGKLPQIGGALGKSIREFRNASETKDETPAATDTTPTEQKKSGL
jgi:sec-independent protein translocase protein TatA